MRKMILALALVASTATFGCDRVKSIATQTFGGDFEGDITMRATRAKGSGPTSLVIGIKKPKYRVDATGDIGAANPLPAGGAALLLDPPQKKGWALIPAQKKAIVLDFEKMKSVSGGGGGRATTKSNKPPPSVEKTGRKDSVAGYQCEIWNVTSEGQRAEICAAEGITWIDLGDLGWSSPEITLGAVATGANRFPLRIIGFAPNGAEELRLEATKIEKKKLDDARFVVPLDYEIIDPAALLDSIPLLGGARTTPP